MRGDRREQPGQLGVLAHVGLAEEDAALRVEPGGEQDRGRVVEPLAQLGGVEGDRERVQVDDAEDRRLAPVLALDVLADRADVVAEVLAAGRLDAGEDDGGAHGRSLFRARAAVPLVRTIAGPVGPAFEYPPVRASRIPRRRRHPAAVVRQVRVLALARVGSRSRRRGRTRRRRRSRGWQRPRPGVGFSIPRPATMPPAIISRPAIRTPRWKAEVEASGASAVRGPLPSPPVTLLELGRDHRPEHGDRQQAGDPGDAVVDPGGDPDVALLDRVEHGRGQRRHRRREAEAEDEDRRQHVGEVVRRRRRPASSRIRPMPPTIGPTAHRQPRPGARRELPQRGERTKRISEIGVVASPASIGE